MGQRTEKTASSEFDHHHHHGQARAIADRYESVLSHPRPQRHERYSAVGATRASVPTRFGTEPNRRDRGRHFAAVAEARNEHTGGGRPSRRECESSGNRPDILRTIAGGNLRQTGPAGGGR